MKGNKNDEYVSRWTCQEHLVWSIWIFKVCEIHRIVWILRRPDTAACHVCIIIRQRRQLGKWLKYLGLLISLSLGGIFGQSTDPKSQLREIQLRETTRKQLQFKCSDLGILDYAQIQRPYHIANASFIVLAACAFITRFIRVFSHQKRITG